MHSIFLKMLYRLPPPPPHPPPQELPPPENQELPVPPELTGGLAND